MTSSRASQTSGLQTVNHAARGFDVGGEALLHQTLHHERLEQFQRHFFGQTALIEAQLGPTTITERPE